MKAKLRDIQNEEDIKQMVDSFYDKVNEDPLLSKIFNDFAQVDWKEHLPTMYRFWNTLIFGKSSYKGNPFSVHRPLPIGAEHFTRWVALFEANIDEQFNGKVVENTKLRARSIAHIFQSKLEFIHKP